MTLNRKPDIRILFYYQVVYWEDDTKPDTVGKVRISSNYTAVNISSLRGSTQYYLAVSAFNTAGTGPQSPPINVTTKKPRECLCRLTEFLVGPAIYGKQL